MSTNLTKWDQILAELVSTYSADVGMIFRLNPDDDYLYLVAHTKGFPEHMMGLMSKIPNGKGVAGETAKTKKPVFASNITSPDAPACIRPLAKTMGIIGMISFPMLDGEDVVGTIGLGNFKEREFSEQQIAELLEIGSKLAKEMKNDSNL